MIKVKDGYAKLIGTTYIGTADRVLLSNGGDKAVSDFAAASALSDYVTLATAQTISGIKTFSGGNVPVKLNSTGNEVGVQFLLSSAAKGWVGHTKTTGTYIYNYSSSKYIGVKDDGTPYYHNGDFRTLLHSGNYSSYALPLSGGTLTSASKIPLTITSTDTYSCIRFTSKNTDQVTFGIKENGTLFVTNIGGWSNEYAIYHQGNLTKVSQLNNDAGYTTATGHTHDYLPLSGGTMSGDLTFGRNNTDAFINFYHVDGKSSSWRIGYLGTGSSNANYLVFESTDGNGTGEWKRAFQLGCYNHDATFSGTVSSSKFIGNLQGNAATATKATNDSDGNTINSTYLKLTGGTLTGSLTVNSNVSFNGHGSTISGHMYRNSYDDSGNVYDHYYTSGATYTNSQANLRVKSGNSYKVLTFSGDGSFKWAGNIIWHAGNDGSGSGLDADLLDGFHVNTGSTGKCFGKIPVIGTDGVTELGHYIDWHYDNTTSSDYSTRLQVSGNHGNKVNLPSATGTLALTSEIPTSLKNPNAIKFKNASGVEVSYDGSAAIDLTGGINYASAVSCTSTSDNVARPIVLTATNNKLYYSSKATINYSTGAISCGPISSGDIVAGNITTTADIKLSNSSGGDSPRLIFERGNSSDGTYDWDIYVKNGGSLKIRRNAYGTWNEIMSLYNDNNTIVANWSIVGNLTGNVTGDCSGSSGSCTGNAATATKATNDSDGNAINSTYLKRSGGTMTGAITLASGNNKGIKFSNGATLQDVSSDDPNNIVLFKSALRFQTNDAQWDYSQWAGLKYDHSSKSIYLGLPGDGTIFTKNTATTKDGTLKLPNISSIKLDGNKGESYIVLNSGNSSVSLDDQTLTVKINGLEKSLTNTNTHYTTRIYAGASGAAAHATATNPYLKVTDNNTYRNQVQFVGSGATTVSSDTNGVITISSTDTNTNTHYTTGINAGASKATSNSAQTNPYVTVKDDSTYRSQIQFKGSGATSVSSDANGVITISSTDTNTNTWRGITDSVSTTDSTISGSATAVKTAYDKAVSAYTLANSKTANTGTVTSVATGAGLTGGSITTSGTIKTNLKSETKSTLSAESMGATSNRQYAVGLDKDGYLSVNIPWSDTNTNTNYYPTAFSWTAGSTAGPTGSLTGSGMSAVSFAAIPSASSAASGIVTTGAQTFAGSKTFNSDTYINSTSKLYFNYSSSYTTTSNYVYGSSTTYLALNGYSGMQFRIAGTSKLTLTASALYPSTANANSTTGVSLGTSANRFTYGYFAASVYAYSGFYQSSDERLKKMVKPIEIDFSQLKKIPKTYFYWNNDPNNLHIGTSAQQLQKYFPELTSKCKKTGMLSVNYDKLGVIALAAIDKLNERIEILEKENLEYRNKINRLMTLIDVLK